MALVTLVIPNYNGARFVGETIESLLAQTFGDFELVFLDDQSTDASLAVAESFSDPRLRVVRSRERVSMAGNWNRCAALVRSPYFVLAHNDDVYEPRFLEVMLPLLSESPGAFMAHCKVQNIDENGLPIMTEQQRYKDSLWPAESPYERPIAEEIAWLRKGNIVIAPTALYRTEAFRAIGPFDERYQFVTDWEYWLRGLLSGYAIVGTQEKLLRWRRHGNSATKALEANLQRFHEEIAVTEWVAREVRERGIDGDPTPQYGLVLNTMTSEFASRLARSDRPGARALMDLALSMIPTFRGSPRHALMRAALAGGTPAGVLLKQGETALLTLLRAASLQRKRG